MFEKGLLGGKRILVTGGGTGLGKSMGRRSVELGADLVICGRREAMLVAAAREFEAELGVRIETHICDVRSADAVETMMRLGAADAGGAPRGGGEADPAAPLWRAHRAGQPGELSRLGSGRLHHRRMRGYRRRQALSRRCRNVPPC